MKQATIAATFVLACVFLSVSASYFLFGRSGRKINDLDSRMTATGVLMQMDENAIKSVNDRVTALSAKEGSDTSNLATVVTRLADEIGMDDNWWCGSDEQTGQCFRSHSDCSAFEGHADKTCVPQHIAFCAPPRTLNDYDFCFRTLAMCQGFGVSGHQSCKGVE
jgi:hypothetical protein